MLGNSTFLNAILYKGKHPKKNINISYSKYYYNMFYSCFRFLTPREGFFMQLIFFGKIVDIKGAPFETHEDIYEKMKAGINQCEIQYYQGELFSQIEQIDTNIDFISFSDILSYFPKDLEEIYLQKIKSKLNLGAKTIHRYFFHVNKNLDIADYQKVTDNYTSNINNEKTQIYLIDIYQKD